MLFFALSWRKGGFYYASLKIDFRLIYFHGGGVMSNRFDSYVGQFQWIRHLNKELLFIEFHGGHESEALRWLDFLTQDLSGRRDGSVLLLAELGNASYSPRLALEWQRHQELLYSKCSKVAAHRPQGIISIAIATFLSVAKAGGLEIGHKLSFFDNLDSAKDWLVQEAEIKAPPRFSPLEDVETTE